MKKRILPALLALCMVISLLPVSVFAENVNKDVTGQTVTYKCACDNEEHNGDCNGTVTLTNQTVTVSVDENADNDAITAAVTSKIQELASTKKAGEVCDNCKTAHSSNGNNDNNNNNNNNQHSDANCALNPDHSGPHKYLCTQCTLGPNCTYSKHNQQNNGCTELVDNYGDTCTGCKAAMSIVAEAEKASANLPENRDCNQNANNNDQRTNCQNTTHQADCAMACKATGTTGSSKCTLTKDHSGKHNSTECTNDAQCAATTHGNNDVNCPNWSVADATSNGTTTRTARASKVYTVTVNCTCTTDHTTPQTQADPVLHTGVVVSGKHSDSIDVEVTVYKQYTYTVVYKRDSEGNPTTEEDATATETNRKNSEAQNASFDQNDEPQDVDNELKICDYCKAALAAKEAKDEAEAYADCNMTAECQKGVQGAKHNDDCLSLCTLTNDCENTAGDASAHVVKYRVIKTLTKKAINVTNNGETYEIDQSVAPVASQTPMHDFLTYAEAKAWALDNKHGQISNEQKMDVYEYDIRTIHCPKSGGVDSTVLTVEADGTVTETPETKAPEKAEDFTDVKGDEFFAKELTFLVEKGIFNGIQNEDGSYKFDPKEKVSTQQVVTVMFRIMGEDVDWNDAMAKAEENGYLDGIEIAEDGSAARQDIILLGWRMAGKPDVEVDDDVLARFTDLDGLEGDRLSAMKWAVSKGIMLGSSAEGPSEMRPTAMMTRDESVMIYARMFREINK